MRAVLYGHDSTAGMGVTSGEVA